MARSDIFGFSPRKLILTDGLEPLLFRTLVVADSDERDNDSRLISIEPQPPISLIQSKPSAFFRDSVRHLCLTVMASTSDYVAVFTACSAVENLWIVPSSVRALCDQSHASLLRLNNVSGDIRHAAKLRSRSLRNTGEPLLELNNVPKLAQDLRFLIIVCSNFRENRVKGATLGRDYWSRAEDFIAKRNSREINPLQYCIPENHERDGGEDDSGDQ
ncbi:hypothetical protein DFH08DRAFT_940197 [Mycena albidolilacea]|uniref:Uncharacterized protein n=1 Tax=Mycena albidolilacea TaxID=1033008 RepID=A0AAD7EL57_9AGAR|nr:hypothetical protein DFH08DRAFT_940197 [Mycena albidolilacea]